MPEGPEVSAICDELFQYVGCELQQIEIITNRYGGPKWKQFESRLPLKLIDVRNRGKCLIIVFEGNIFITSTLGMSGYWRVSQKNENLKHDHVCFDFLDNQTKQLFLFYNDTRRFGNLDIFMTIEEVKPRLLKIGSSWLSMSPRERRLRMSLEEFRVICENSPRQNICRFLMDQSKTSGIGNYLLSEIIYDAKIDYNKQVGELTEEELERIYNSASCIIWNSYQSQGLSIRDYETPSGKKGTFELKIYQKGKRIRGPHGRSLFI